MHPTKIVDLFAGPGGLGEGFSSLRVDGAYPFQIAVSVEKDKCAQSTLKLRAYSRLLRRRGRSLEPLYAYYKGLTDSPVTPADEDLWNEAGSEALLLELGEPKDNTFLYERISQLLSNDEHWVLIGGPPCQAYSVVGRVRSGANNEKDPRHYLYQEYLNVIRQFRPSVFVMENVRGLLSCQLDQKHIIHCILEDLSRPGESACGAGNYSYTIHSLVAHACYEPGMDASNMDLKKFVVQCEEYGVPQARHRVILVGIREDITSALPKLEPSEPITVWDAIGDMPALRSGLSRQTDSVGAWKSIVVEACTDLAKHASEAKRTSLAQRLQLTAEDVERRSFSRGGQWISGSYGSLVVRGTALHQWLRDAELGGWLNHETRSHMASDLRRYAYVAAYARAEGKNPLAAKDFDFPGLPPDHANWDSGHFDDRFKAQLEARPSSTITSHLAKDGHSFIHPDPTQCRSLTVREAARLQTFPDNYFFEGPRTAQYVQVGNAVPPLLARQIAEKIWAVLKVTHGVGSY